MDIEKQIETLNSQINSLRQQLKQSNHACNERLVAAEYFSDRYGTDPDVVMLMDYHDFKVAYGDSFERISDYSKELISSIMSLEVLRDKLVKQSCNAVRTRKIGK